MPLASEWVIVIISILFSILYILFSCIWLLSKAAIPRRKRRDERIKELEREFIDRPLELVIEQAEQKAIIEMTPSDPRFPDPFRKEWV